MDKIIIEDLEVYAYHGVASEEKSLGQMFLISVEARVDLTAAGHSDDINDTIHYGHVCGDIEDVVVSHKYNLIETLAQDIAKCLLQHYPKIQNIKVTVKKPWAPIRRHIKYVAVEVERTR